MTSSTPRLPGKLGDPTLTLATDPRLDPRLRDALEDYGISDWGEMAATDQQPSLEEILDGIAEAEAMSDALYAGIFASLPPVPGVARRTEATEGVDGNEIRLYIHEPEHEPEDREGPLPGIVHTHGGGMVLMTARDPQYVRWRDELAASGLCVIGVEFRNAAGKLGNHPFPAGLNDCASGARWAWRNRDALGISNVVISGESGGGNLCLATALKAKREGWIDEIAGVYSCCPYISGTYDPPAPELVSLVENDLMGTRALTQQWATAYDPGGANTRNPLAWPYHATPADLEGLPPHTVSVNELDELRDEGLLYARKLMRAGVPTISRTVNGTHHGGDTEYWGAAPHVCRATVRDIQGFAASLV